MNIDIEKIERRPTWYLSANINGIQCECNVIKNKRDAECEKCKEREVCEQVEGKIKEMMKIDFFWCLLKYTP